jgi:hypothetical protein
MRPRDTSIINGATIHARRKSQEIKENPKMRNIRGVISHISLAFTLCSQTTTAQQILQKELDELKKNQKPNP